MPVYKFAGFWRRLVAYIIDNTIICIIYFILTMIATIAFIIGAASGEENKLITDLADPTKISVAMIIIWLFFLAISLGYFTYFHGATGRTPGKMLLGLQVVNDDGTPLTFGIAFLRSVGYLVSGAIFNIGFIWAAFDKRKQSWHDKIAGTVVIICQQENQSAGISIPDKEIASQMASQGEQTSTKVNRQVDDPLQVPQNNN